MSIAITTIDQYWLKSQRFDLFFIVGVATLAISSGALVVARPDWFIYVLTADLWLLGYHHVASTYTRIAFDKDSFREHRLKLTALPVIVAVLVTGIILVFGPWMLATIYLYWQWYHYTRQSEGISKAYQAKSPAMSEYMSKLNRVIFWLIPITGLANTSARAPEMFLFMPVETIPVPMSLVNLLNFVAATSYLWWLTTHIAAVIRHRITPPWFLYVNLHFAIYAVAYIFIDKINHGWLVINIWHNAQYILFVWLFNNRRFNNKISDKHLLLSTISKSKNFFMYLGFCLALSSSAYFLIERIGVDFVQTMFGVSALAAAMIIYQTINFHHYVVDAAIWKLRKNPIRTTLGLNG